MNEQEKLKLLAESVSGWGNCNQAWLDTSEDNPAAVVGSIDEDGEMYPVMVVDCDKYFQGQDSLKLAKFYAAANPKYIMELLSIIDEQAKRIEELEARQEWQHIETAPKDGTQILGWNEEFGARQTKMNFYGYGSIGYAEWERGEGPKESGWDWTEPKNNWGFSWNPTHWMPLPASPNYKE